MHRRDVLTGFGGVAAAAAAATLGGEPPVSAWQGGLPRQHDFVIEDGCTYINAAYTHPIPKVALEAVRRAAAGRHTLKAPGGDSTTPPTATVRALFAELINAKPSEIAFVPSTSAGENLVVQALELHRRFDGNVVTDGLHFEGAILHLMEQQKQGSTCAS